MTSKKKNTSQAVTASLALEALLSAVDGLLDAALALAAKQKEAER